MNRLHNDDQQARQMFKKRLNDMRSKPNNDFERLVEIPAFEFKPTANKTAANHNCTNLGVSYGTHKKSTICEIRCKYTCVNHSMSAKNGEHEEHVCAPLSLTHMFFFFRVKIEYSKFIQY
jgi:hypothetical protein